MSSSPPDPYDPIPIPSGHANLQGWFSSPSESSPVPCVVMAHGLGGTVACGLRDCAEAFRQAGFAVLMFDYSSFGQSGGEPRQDMNIHRQLQEWRAAVTFARSHPQLDPESIILWGTSYAGGHVLTLAAEDPKLAAVIAQCPMADGLAAILNAARYGGLGPLCRLVGRAVADIAARLTGLPPVYLPLVAEPGHLACMSTPDALPGYQAIAGADWENRITSRFLLGTALYRPVSSRKRIRIPVLVQGCATDSVAPVSAARKYAPHATYQEFECGHFDVYQEPWRSRLQAEQVAFLQDACGLECGEAAVEC